MLTGWQFQYRLIFYEDSGGSKKAIVTMGWPNESSCHCQVQQSGAKKLQEMLKQLLLTMLQHQRLGLHWQ